MTIICDEVKIKLKMAMMKKLEEMGIYVEKELPDYILSIICNKKDKMYMEKSLGVFMGNNATFFTDWLYHLFERIASEQKPVALADNNCIDSNTHRNEGRTEEGNRKRRSDDEMKHVNKKTVDVDRDEKPDQSKRKSHRRSPCRRKESAISVMVKSTPIKKVASSVTRVRPSELPRIASKVIVKRKPSEAAREHVNLFNKALSDMLKPELVKRDLSKTSLKVKIKNNDSYRTPVMIQLNRDVKEKKDEHNKEIPIIESYCSDEEIDKFGRFLNRVERFPEILSPEPLKSPLEVANYVKIPVRPVLIPETEASGEPVKQNQKCKFWPECSNSNCPYIHPNKICVAFPKCQFGRECIFIHPPCRYAKFCYNQTCTFTHAHHSVLEKLKDNLEAQITKLKIGEMSLATPCRFAGKCLSPSCKFKHPVKCRYMDNCKSRDCAYYHGPLTDATHPNPDQFKWHATV